MRKKKFMKKGKLIDLKQKQQQKKKILFITFIINMEICK